MSLSLRPKGTNDPYYNPGRDLAYCYPRMVAEVVKRFNSHRWVELEALVASEGVTYEQLCDAMDAYILFLNSAHSNPEEEMPECMDKAGWLNQPKAAQIAIMAMLGTVATGQLFYAIRDTSSPDKQRADIAEIVEYAGVAKQYIYAHPLRARFWVLRRKAFSAVRNAVRTALRYLRSKN